jgi:alanyl-tRNA synthetase
LHFACGFRALVACGADRERIESLVRLLTCHPDEIEARCDKLVAEAKTQRKDNDSLRSALAAAQAQAALAGAPRPGGVPVVVRQLEAGAGEVGLRELATALVEAGAVALLGRAGERAELLFARPDGLALDLRPALRAACEPIDGKGGGPPGRVQGAGPRLDGLSAALDAARADVVGRLSAP